MSCEHEHHNHGPPPIDTNASQSLVRWIDTAKLTALNMANPESDLPLLFKTTDSRYEVHPIIQSDLDSELIIHIPFECPVKVYSVIFRTSSADEHCPKTIKVYKNALDKTFEDIESLHCDHEFTHPQGVGLDHDSLPGPPASVEGDATFVESHLPRRKFSGVGGITVHFCGNWAGPQCESPVILYALEIRGEASNFRGGKVSALYEAAPQARGSIVKSLGTNVPFM